MAWRGKQTIFVEYEGPGEARHKNAGAWIAAALDAGVSPNDRLIVTNP